MDSFINEARSYCALVESDEKVNSWTFAQDCLMSILRLYERALLLPAFEPATDSVTDTITYEILGDMKTRISEKLSRDFYWEVFEPLEQRLPEPTLGSLSDDLADIWHEIKIGLVELDNGEPTSLQEAMWQWRTSFEFHWRRHAAAAIVALTALCYGEFADTSRPWYQRKAPEVS